MYDKPVLGFLFLFFFPPLKKNLRSTTWLGAMSYLRVQVSCDRGRRNYRLERSNGMLRCNAMGRMMGERWRLSIRTGAGPLLFLFLSLSLSLSTIHREEHSSNANWCQHTAHKTSTHTPLPDGVQCLSARVVNTPQNISPERRRRRRKKTSR
jgi:hypothetical protein